MTTTTAPTAPPTPLFIEGLLDVVRRLTAEAIATPGPGVALRLADAVRDLDGRLATTRVIPASWREPEPESADVVLTAECPTCETAHPVDMTADVTLAGHPCAGVGTGPVGGSCGVCGTPDVPSNDAHGFPLVATHGCPGGPITAVTMSCAVCGTDELQEEDTQLRWNPIDTDHASLHTAHRSLRFTVRPDRYADYEHNGYRCYNGHDVTFASLDVSPVWQ